jgi:hypothetical protein
MSSTGEDQTIQQPQKSTGNTSKPLVFGPGALVLSKFFELRAILSVKANFVK